MTLQQLQYFLAAVEHRSFSAAAAALHMAMIPVVGAATVGTLLGVLVAIVFSGQFPMAIARAAEPDPGLRVDLVALAGGAAALFAAPRRLDGVRSPPG